MKLLPTLFLATALIFSVSADAAVDKKNNRKNGNGIGGNNGATVEHSALVNENNNGKAGEGNNGN